MEHVIIFTIIGIFGFILVCVAISDLFKENVNKKRHFALLAIGQILILPGATAHFIIKGNALSEYVFIAVLIAGLIAVYYLYEE